MTERTRLSLDGTWQFWADPDGRLTPDALPRAEASTITVPAPWQAQFEALRDYSGVAWYRREVELPREWLNALVILGFGAVDYHAEVWLNGRRVGEHEGGYLPFEFDVTDAARPGPNTLVVRVDDPNECFRELPHGKQSWYGPLSGIWQSVWLERRAATHLAGVQLFPDLATGQVAMRVTLAGEPLDAGRLVAEVVGPDGESVARAQQPLVWGEAAVELAAPVSEPLAWSPDAPHLYRVALRLVAGDETLDRVEASFGFRTIEAREGRLYLNGAPLFLRAALDQDYYPDTICTPPSLALLEEQVRRAKELGLNCLRCHIKAPDPRYYQVADRLGMLVWSELPNWHSLTPRAAELARATMRGIVERDGNHPSLIIWTLVNEDWGTNLMHDPAHRAWLKELVGWLKALDPTRLVVDNSPCVGNFHIQSDIEDYHFYRAIPDQRLEWDNFVDHFASRTALTYSPFGDAVRTGEEPLILSEFGNWGLPDANALTDGQGRDPWWFETGLAWGEGVVYPHGVRERFRRYHLERVFGGWQPFIEATQWHEFYALKYEIESIRRRSEIQGYVITEFTDVHWECNGLLDMRRHPKAFHHALATVVADTVIVPDWQRTAYRAGEEVELRLLIAHGAGAPLPEGKLAWSLEGGASGELAVSGMEAGTVQLLGAARFAVPEVAAPVVARLELALHAAGGTGASNHLPLTLFPRWQGPPQPERRVWSPHPLLTAHLRALGYTLALRPDEADVLVVDVMDHEALRLLREGHRLLWLAGHLGAQGQEVTGLRVVARQGTAWRGEWASSFAWLRRAGPFARLPGGPLLDYSFDSIIPDFVLTGLAPWDFEAHVHAGLFVGWIHKPAGLIVERRYGAGRLVATTFRLPGPVLDPTATTLLDALVELAMGTN